MYDTELKIKREDWLFIAFFGVLFGATIAALGYSLLAAPFFDGAAFGALLGFFISFLSLFFITVLNTRILPKLPHSYWQIGSMFFSFLAGFLGALLAFECSSLLGLESLPALDNKRFEISAVIGLLTYIIGVLLHRFVKMRNENEKISELLLQSRVSSLETQLNPHFMFNSINSIVELVHTEPSKAEEALIGMSEFLRGVMKEDSLVSIDDEIESIKKYVALENIRFDGKIRVAVFRDNDVGNFLVPKFSIGLIVENAIKHGFEPYKILNISINASKKGDFVEISIKNDGKEIKSKKFGIGLTNLSERLRYLCDGELELGCEEKREFIMRLKAKRENSYS